jgi:hypothetical protein
VRRDLSLLFNIVAMIAIHVVDEDGFRHVSIETTNIEQISLSVLTRD